MENSGQDSFLPKIDFEKPRRITDTAICAGEWTLAVKGQPDWAFKAFNEFCRCCWSGLRDKSFGYGALKPRPSKAAEHFIAPNSAQATDGEVNHFESNLIESRRPASLAEAAIIFGGGKLIQLALPEPDGNKLFFPPTARAYLFFFIAWREISALETKKVSAIHKWLIRMKALPADPPHKDSSRNTRTLLKRIGFPLDNKGGRPKKKNPTTARLPRRA